MLTGAGGSGGSNRRQRVVSGTRFSPSRSGSRSTTSGGSYRSSSGGGAPSAPSPSYSAPTSYGYSASPAPSNNRNFGPVPSSGSAHPKPKKPEPKPPSVKKYLGTDEQYQRDRAALLKNFRNLRSSNMENRGNVRLDKRTTLSRLREEQSENLQEMRDDFAARGLYGGAEYLKKESDFNNDYLDQFSDTRQSANRSIQQLMRDLRNAKTLRNENMSQSRLEAIRRRAAKYGIRE